MKAESGPAKKGHCAHKVRRQHIACEDSSPQRRLLHSCNQRRIPFHPFAHRKSWGNTIDQYVVASEPSSHGTRERYDRTFTGHVMGHERISFERDARRHVYDSSASSNLELRENRTRAEIYPSCSLPLRAATPLDLSPRTDAVEASSRCLLCSPGCRFLQTRRAQLQPWHRYLSLRTHPLSRRWHDGPVSAIAMPPRQRPAHQR